MAAGIIPIPSVPGVPGMRSRKKLLDRSRAALGLLGSPSPGDGTWARLSLGTGGTGLCGAGDVSCGPSGARTGGPRSGMGF